MDEILKWEERLLDEHDLSDMADCVQRLRMLAWTANVGLDSPLPMKRGVHMVRGFGGVPTDYRTAPCSSQN